MYSYAVGSLPAEIAEEIDGLLKNPPAYKPLECLKESILRRVGNAKVKDLYTNMSLGDKTISQLLRYMKSFLGNKLMDEGIMRQLWFEKLPTNDDAHIYTIFL